MDQNRKSPDPGLGNQPDTGHPIGKDDLLKAIDYEIADRESAITKLGVSAWGLAIAFAGVFWMLANEALDKSHDFTETLLVFFCTYFLMGLFRSFFGEAVIRRLYREANSKSRKNNLRNLIWRLGINPDALLFQISVCLVLIVAGVVLAMKGYVLLGLLWAIFLTAGTLLLALVYVLSLVRYPFLDSGFMTSSSSSLTIKIGTPIVLVAFLWLQLKILGEASSLITSEDWRLGILAAGLLTIAELCSQHMRQPPDLSLLKSIRRRLAFGWVLPEEAKADIENLLIGHPANYRIATKAAEFIDAHGMLTNYYSEVLQCMNSYVKIGDEYSTADDKAAFLDRQRETLIDLNRTLKRLFSSIMHWTKHKDQVEKILLLEIRIAKTFGVLTASEQQKLLGKMAITYKQLQDSVAGFDGVLKQYSHHSKVLLEAYGGKIASKLPPLKWKEVIESLLRE